MTDNDSVLSPLDGKSATLFLVAGTLLIPFAVLTGINEFTNAAYPNLENTFGPAGFVFGFLGLLGLYPALADRKVRLASVAVLFATLGVVGFSVVTVRNLTQIAGVGFPSWLKFMQILAFVGFLGGYPLFGVTSLITDVHSRTVSLLLLTPVAVFAVMLSGLLSTVMSHALSLVVLASAQALSHLAIGVSLRTGGVPADRREPAADATP